MYTHTLTTHVGYPESCLPLAGSLGSLACSTHPAPADGGVRLVMELPPVIIHVFS